MITVSSDYKDAAKALSKEIKAYLVDQEDTPTEITGEDDLQGFMIRTETSLLHTVLRYAEVRHLGNHNFIDKWVNLGFGHVISGGTTEFIDYGSFKVVKREVEQSNDVVKLTLWDKMVDSLVPWDLDPIYDITYPCTMVELLEAICARFSWTLKTDTFTNSDLTIEEDIFVGVVESYREVLDMIAEAAGGIIYFDVDDELVVKEVSHDTSVDNLDKSVLPNLKVETKFGPVNSIVLSRQPLEDNIADVDQGSIDLYGLTEIKIANNLIMDSDRETHAETLLDELGGLELYPFETETNGLGYFQPGDRVTMSDRTDTEFEVIVTGIELDVAAGARERLFAYRPDKSTTQYQYAGIVGQRIKKTEAIVDKQAGLITLLTGQVDTAITQLSLSMEAITATANAALQLGDVNSDNIEDLQQSVTQLEITAEALEIAVSGIGGTNLLKNSVGLKGDIKDWQNLDSSGSPIDSDNNGTVVQNSEVDANSESGSAIRIDEQYIEQTFPTIVGETYTFYSRFESDGDVLLKITGSADTVLLEQTDWAVAKHQFIATAPNTTLRISNVASGSGSWAILTDLVCKLGDANGWTQAPNEVYGQNYVFDKDGFAISSLTDTFKAVLDNTKYKIVDTAGGEKIILLVSKDSATLTNVIVQDELTVQRYENPTKSARFIPTDTGMMLVIND